MWPVIYSLGKNGIWYAITIYIILCNVIFKEFYVTARQDTYDLICVVDAYKKRKYQSYGSISSGGRTHFPETL